MLKLKIDKVTVIRVTKCPFLADSPCSTSSSISCVILNLKIYSPSKLLFRAGAAAAAGAAAFFCTTYRGKFLQHKLIRVQCTKKSTRVPVSPVPRYGYSV